MLLIKTYTLTLSPCKLKQLKPEKVLSDWPLYCHMTLSTTAMDPHWGNVSPLTVLEVSPHSSMASRGGTVNLYVCNEVIFHRFLPQQKVGGNLPFGHTDHIINLREVLSSCLRLKKL